MSLSLFANSLYVDTMGPISCALTPFKKATKEQKILKSLFVSNMLLSIVAVDYNLSPAFEKTGQQEVKLMYITIAVAFLEVHLKTTLRRLLNRTENTKLKTYYAALKQNLAHLGSGGGQGGGRKRGGGRRTQKGGWWPALMAAAPWVKAVVVVVVIQYHKTITGWVSGAIEMAKDQRELAQKDMELKLIERGQNATAAERQADRDATAALAAAKLADDASQAALARNHTRQLAADANNATVTASQLAADAARDAANAAAAAANATAQALIESNKVTADGAITIAATTAGAAVAEKFAELGAQHAAASRSDLNFAEEMLRTAAATFKAEVETCRGTAMEYAQLQLETEEETATTAARRRLALVTRCVKGVQERNEAAMAAAEALVADKKKMYHEAVDRTGRGGHLRLDTGADGSVIITTAPHLTSTTGDLLEIAGPAEGGGGNPGGGYKRKYRKRRRKTKRRRRKKRKTRRKRHRRTRRRR